jgi:hypothetical protein
MRPSLVLIALLGATTLAAPQEAVAQGTLPRPVGWRILLDGGARDTVYYVQMPPGWHITTGPGALLFDPAYQASERFAVEAEMFLFPGTSESGYGIFVGGAGLNGPSASYLAYVARRDGHVRLEHVSPGGTPHALVDWMRAESIKPSQGMEDPVRNVLRMSVERDSIVLEANGSRVTAVPRADLSVEGVFGFRVGPDINLHASRLDHTRRLAPVPAKKRAD